MSRRDDLGFVLDFCYPDDPAFYSVAPRARNQATEKIKILMTKLHPRDAEQLRAAVLDVLRCHVQRDRIKEESVTEIEKAINVPIRLHQSGQGMLGRTPKTARMFKNGLIAQPSLAKSSARTVCETLLRYLDSPGKPLCVVCQVCGKVMEKTKGYQRFCSDQCRWDFWNARKMSDYYRAAKKRSRDNKSRLQKIKKGKQA